MSILPFNKQQPTTNNENLLQNSNSSTKKCPKSRSASCDLPAFHLTNAPTPGKNTADSWKIPWESFGRSQKKRVPFGLFSTWSFWDVHEISMIYADLWYLWYGDLWYLWLCWCVLILVIFGDLWESMAAVVIGSTHLYTYFFDRSFACNQKASEYLGDPGWSDTKIRIATSTNEIWPETPPHWESRPASFVSPKNWHSRPRFEFHQQLIPTFGSPAVPLTLHAGNGSSISHGSRDFLRKSMDSKSAGFLGRGICDGFLGGQ